MVAIEPKTRAFLEHVWRERHALCWRILYRVVFDLSKRSVEASEEAQENAGDQSE